MQRYMTCGLDSWVISSHTSPNNKFLNEGSNGTLDFQTMTEGGLAA